MSHKVSPTGLNRAHLRCQEEEEEEGGGGEGE